MPNQLHEELLNGKTMAFQAVPEPSKEELIDAGYLQVDPETGDVKHLKADPKALEWAKQLGLATDYSLPKHDGGKPAGKHIDDQIQTLLYPYEMENILRNISSKSKTAIEESGANILYLALGFLEWYERSDSSETHLAPLYLIPVRIDKGKLDSLTNTYSYRLSYTEEDIVSNLSLREKLRNDFNLALPELSADQTPEQYLASIERSILKAQPNWKVRRFASLGMLNFGKLLMYLDLDPTRWPNGDGNISNHEVVKEFFGTESRDAQGSSFQVEYDIDNLNQIHEDFPLIDNADSSQHSALIDVIKGKNTVIEGPPGTGKSQTITNIIAAAIAQGKKVLFVAEKMAALNVVKHRLDKAGLGGFCLELHSHKTNKRKLLDSISESFKFRDNCRAPEAIERDIEKYEQYKADLQNYAQLINQPWKQTGLSIHEILMSATRHRKEIGQEVINLSILNVTGEQLTTNQLHALTDITKQFKHAYELVAQQVGLDADLEEHPWFGVENQTLQAFDSDAILSALKQWQAAIGVFQEKAQEFCTSLGMPQDSIPSTTAFNELISEIRDQPTLKGDEFFTPIEKLDGKVLQNIEQYCNLYNSIQKAYKQHSDTIHDSALDRFQLEDLVTIYKSAISLGVNKHTTLETLKGQHKSLEEGVRLANEIASNVEQIAPNLPPQLTHLGELTLKGLKGLLEILKLSQAVPLSALSYRSDLFDNEELDEVLPRVEAELSILTPLYKKLSLKFDLAQVPNQAELLTMHRQLADSGLFSWLSSDWRKARKRLLSLACLPDLKFKDLLADLSDLVEYSNKYSEFVSKSQYQKVLANTWDELDTDINTLTSLRFWYKSVRAVYGASFGPSVAIGSAVLSLDANTLKGFKSLYSQGFGDKISKLLSLCNGLKTCTPGFKPLASLDYNLLNSEVGLANIKERLTLLLDSFAQWFKHYNFDFITIKKTIKELKSLSAKVRSWDASPINASLFDGQLQLKTGPSFHNAYEFERLERSILLYKYVQKKVKTPALAKYLKGQKDVESIERLQLHISDLKKYYQQLVDQLSIFSELVHLDSEAWFNCCGDNLQAQIKRNEEAINHVTWLVNWVDYIKLRTRLGGEGLSNLFKSVESKKLTIDKVEQGLQYSIFDLLSREVFSQHPDLDKYSGVFLSSIRERFSEYDKKLQKLQREKIAWSIAQKVVPKGKTGSRAADLTEAALLQRECEKKTRHRPIRELLQRSGQALVALKPCFMMGPMSVAQYIEPGQIEFDLLVMDEASQVKPEDALGAIARSKQVVVVGDPKQLPPTRFFDRQIQVDYNDETTSIEESQSILDAAMPMFNLRCLRWHYRSQHESLIAFSNRNFYGGDLVIFPSPYSENDDYGVKFTPVRGRFIDQKNLEEARVIAKCIHHHLLERPNESIGVVTMNRVQQEQIERAIEERSKADGLLQEALLRNEQHDEPLFVKNLENVQGDERDVIFISFTYGPSETGGKPHQRFGPINGADGWRRLNVLFTRSKKRMHVFSSLEPGHIVTSESSSQGVVALKSFIEFAQTGGKLLDSAVHTGRGPDSDFEIDVANRLRNAGFECEYQVGIAGYFIDIAVKDPGKPGRYLAGVECDGATYHSAKSVRDRDRLRQAVLEQLGWNIKRIWSTDWFKNPEAILRPLIEQLHQLKSEPTAPVLQSEIVEISKDIERWEAHEEQINDVVTGESNLKSKLLKFEREVIKPVSPDVDDTKRLLRPSMLEALLEFEPTTLSEFQEVIPAFLRHGTDRKQGKYLQDIFEIIEGSLVSDELE
ncbi:MAG: DUF4011 domain-containing protein [Endozoicomonas sp. (ex Botrylloides leachii)]|nr:DUF4011 domain-containing protein [Endozoicomonas sp. (ex Botrylloides leachii)]